MNRSKKGFTLVEIMIVVVIIGLLAALAIPAFNKVRDTSQRKTILNNIRQLAGAAEQYFMEQGVASVAYTQLVGTETDKYVKVINVVAGEDYQTAFGTITAGWTELSLTKAGSTVPIRFNN